jgi:holin-like protein
VKVLHLLALVAQVVLISVLLWACNLLVSRFDCPIPGSVVGLGILVLLLVCKIIPERLVALGCAWLLADMLLFFIPPVVSVLKYESLISHSGFGLAVLLIGGTLIVMTGTALVVDRVFTFEHRLRQEKNHA